MIGTTLAIAALQQATLTGVVRDSVALEPIAFAQVSVTTADGTEATLSGISDQFGAFVVPGVPDAEAVRVEVGAFGYATWIRTYDVPPSEPVRVLLGPAPLGMEGLEVAAGRRAGDPMSLSRDGFVVDSTLMRTLPTILEADVLRATAVSPSASATSDYSAVPFIRGGTSDGTPVLLDGVRLFNAVHLGGFISAVNAEVVESATLLAGSGGDAFAIGSLSGAIKIVTRDGSRDRRRIAGSLGLGSSRFSVEGPIGENTSFLLDGRRTYIGAFTTTLENMGAVENALPYFFQDAHAKVTTELGGLRRLSVSGYLNFEKLTTFDAQETLELGMTSSNLAFSAHYRDRFGANGILDATLGHSLFANDLDFLVGGGFHTQPDGRLKYIPPGDTMLFGDGSMGETRADARVTWRGGRATVVAGTQATRFATDHNYDVSEDVELERDLYFAPLALAKTRWRFAAYSTVEVPLPRGYRTRAGLRLDRFQGVATTLAPFVELGYSTSWWNARISAARSYQALASVRNEEALVASFLAYDILVPVGEAPVPPQHRAVDRVGRFGWRVAGPAGRLRSIPGQPEAAGSGGQTAHRSRAGRSGTVGHGQWYGPRDRGNLGAGWGTGASRSWVATVGRGCPAPRGREPTRLASTATTKWNWVRPTGRVRRCGPRGFPCARGNRLRRCWQWSP